MPTDTELSPAATPLIFVYGYHNLPEISSEGEWVDYYNPTSMDRLRQDFQRYVQLQLDLFSGSVDNGEWFSVAEFSVLLDSIGEEEVAVFRLALDHEDQNVPFGDLYPLDILRGLRAVILERIAAGNLDDIRAAASLFNEILEIALLVADDNRNPSSYVRVETASEFLPWLIDRLFGSIERLDQTWRLDLYGEFVGKKFKPLKPLLDALNRAIRQEGWPRNDLSLGSALLIVDHFKHVVEEEWGF